MKVFVKKILYTVNVGRYTSIIFKSRVNYDELKMFWIKVDTKAGYPAKSISNAALNRTLLLKDYQTTFAGPLTSTPAHSLSKR